MLIDPSLAMAERWDLHILQRKDPLAMWKFFTCPLSSLVDEESSLHIERKQRHVIRMYYLFTLMSIFTSFSAPPEEKIIVRVNNEEYLLKNILCIQIQNDYFEYERVNNIIFIHPLPIIFEIGCFSDCETYTIPFILGGENFACDLFADDPLSD